MTFKLAVNAEVDLGSQKNIVNEFLGSIVYRKLVSYMTYDLLVDKLNFLLISTFFRR